MKKRILSLLLALVMLVGLLPASVLAANQKPPSVTAYFSLTDDDQYVVGDNAGGGSQRVLAYQKVSVPYFDLALYSLENYYFRSETYVPGESGSGSTDEPYGQITLLHLFIYELERDFCGLSEDQCGEDYTFAMSPSFSPDVHDYTILIPDFEYTFYPFLIFRSDAPDNFKATFQFEDLGGEVFASGTKLDAVKLWQGEAGSRHFDLTITPQTFQDASENTVVTVSYGGRYVGGIIGYMHSLDCYNVITNNYYLAGSATSGIDKEKASASLLVYFTDDYTFDSVPVITAAIDALSSSLTEEAISSIDAQLKALSPVALASIPNLELLAQSRDMLAANKAAAAIDAIGDVTLSSGSTIAAAREAYESLTDDQKSLVPNCQLEALMDAEIRYEILVASSAAASAAAKPAKAPQAHTAKALPFTDAASDSWYYDSVKFAYENGLMVGTGANEFSPNADTTRGMVVTILARMEGVNTSVGSVWYEAGRQWAMENGISDGTNMEDVITREQLVTMLCRYAQMKGCDVSGLASLSGYTDASGVSDWALQSMQWAVSAGLITGRSATTLAPRDTATRAETATVLMRFAQNVGK